MSKKVFKSEHIVLKDSLFAGYFVVEDGKISEIKDRYEGEYEDLGKSYIAPGLVDTHIHGFKGKDIMFCERGALNIISEGLLENGVTSFLPTTLTASTETTNEACRIIGEEYKDVKGAKVKGIFLEGPYFTEKYKGAQNTAYMTDPKIEELKKWKEVSDGLVNKIALAPERDGVEDFVREAVKMGVHVALGHSDATYDQAFKAVQAGANIFVHTYNGMRGLHHREPGMVGADFTTDTIGELICDGHHVHPVSAKIVMDIKGRDHVALITDCMMAGGMPDGDYMLGEFPVEVKEGAARLKDGGSLAGSILRLKEAVKNVYDWEDASAFEAIQMATQVPAKSVGIDDECGILEVGRDADFVIFDENLNLKRTYLDGELRYEA